MPDIHEIFVKSHVYTCVSFDVGLATGLLGASKRQVSGHMLGTMSVERAHW